MSMKGISFLVLYIIDMLIKPATLAKSRSRLSLQCLQLHLWHPCLIF
jgi:hypothetical protein